MSDIEILDPADVDPFGLRDGEAVPAEALDGPHPIVTIAEITNEAGENAGANGTARHICRGPAGAYHLIDIGGLGEPCRAVGAPVTFAAASDLAAAILAGDPRALTRPGVTRLLALAYLAALAEAQRRKHRGRAPARDLSPGVPPASSAAPAVEQTPSIPETAGAAA